MNCRISEILTISVIKTHCFTSVVLTNVFSVVKILTIRSEYIILHVTQAYDSILHNSYVYIINR